MLPVHLLHITPELPPTMGGIADYTAILSRRLVEVSGGSVVPTLIRAGWKGDSPTPETEFNTVDCAGECNPAALACTIRDHADSADRTVVLLQYSGYGYAQRGAPWWLVRGLHQACEEASVPLITMFHELYAVGPPWTSAFWLSPAQRYIAARLAHMSQAMVTNRAKSADWLRRYVASGTPVHVQPVFSNVGEPDEVLPYEERDAYAVVFGGRSMKQRLYTALTQEHIHQLLAAGVERIVDIGTPGEAPESVHGCPVEEHGFIKAKTISTWLQHARVGLLHYPTDYLTKSGIWSSYVAHGVLPVIFSSPRSIHLIEKDKHFVRWSVGKHCSLASAGISARMLWHWYQEHACSGNAAHRFLDAMTQSAVTR